MWRKPCFHQLDILKPFVVPILKMIIVKDLTANFDMRNFLKQIHFPKVSCQVCFTDKHLGIIFLLYFPYLDQVPGTSKVEPNQEHDKALAIEQIVSEAVKRVLNENGQLLRNFDASKIMELVGQQKLVEKVVEHLAPPSSGSQLKSETEASNLKAKSHKVYTIPVGTPAYTPTPLAVLKRTKPVGSKDDNYVPSSSESKCTATYQPSKFKSSQVDEYSPSPLDLAPDVNYTPSSRDLNNIINDQYTPLSNTLSDVDYQPTDKALSSTEPSYTPSFSANAEIAQIGSGIQVDCLLVVC